MERDLLATPAPLPGGPAGEATYGSDVVVDMLLRMGIEHLSINPSASLRGLHDSAVNTDRGRELNMVLCCHEEVAAAVAHGYAKTAGKPMAVAVGNIVGLQHASMAVYNAYSDRVPMLLLSGAGPLDADQRRPHVDWVHTTVEQGRIVESVVKWNDQPLSIAALVPSMARAYRLAVSKPRAPVHIALDTGLQEAAASAPVAGLVDGPPEPMRVRPHDEDVERAAAMIAAAQRPVLLAGRLEDAAGDLQELAELVGAPVIDIGQRTGLPGGHDLDVSDVREEILAQADLVVALEPKDLWGQLRTPPDPVTRASRPVVASDAKILLVGVDELLVAGWGHRQYQPVDLAVVAEPEEWLRAVCARLRRGTGSDGARRRTSWWAGVRDRATAAWTAQLREEWDATPVSLPRLGAEIGRALEDRTWVLAHNQMGPWPRRLWRWDASCRFLGLLQWAAVGLGYGPGVATGAGLAVRGGQELVVCVDGDGDLLYTPSALWTAANQRVPALFVVLNNHSYGLDVGHQAAIATGRGRRTDRAAAGLGIMDPAVDVSQLARAFGVHAETAVEDPAELPGALERALRFVDSGHGPALVEVVTGIHPAGGLPAPTRQEDAGP